jgi:hypothetical protein
LDVSRFQPYQFTRPHETQDGLTQGFNSAARWLSRSVAGQMTDQATRSLPKLPDWQHARGFRELAQTSFGHEDFLGINLQQNMNAQERLWARQNYGEYWKKTIVPPTASVEALGLKQTGRHLLFNNFKSLSKAWEQGRYGSVAAGVGGFSLLGLGILKETRQARAAAKARETGQWGEGIKTNLVTAGAFAKSAAKAAVAWELGNIGLIIAKAFLLPFGGPIAMIGGILAGTAFALGGKKLFEGVEKTVGDVARFVLPGNQA